MEETKKAAKPLGGDGNNKSSGKGGGRSDSGGAKVGSTVGAASQRGEQPSPSSRERGETSRAGRPSSR